MEEPGNSMNFEELQRVAKQLDRAAQSADHARQAYIATPDAQLRQSWVQALREQRTAWDRLWHVHRDFFGDLD